MPSAADKSDRQQQGQRQPRRRRRLPRTPLLLAAIAAAVYANTLTAQFTFDDSFAIVSCVVQGRGVVQGVLLLPARRQSPPICLRRRLLLTSRPFAVLLCVNQQIYNGDVTDDRKPLRALLTNDFW